MNHRSKLLALTTVAAVAGLAVFVSSGIGGDDSAPTADSIDLTVTEPKTVSADELKLVDTARMPLRGASASRKSSKLFYYLSDRDVHASPRTRPTCARSAVPVKQQPVDGRRARARAGARDHELLAHQPDPRWAHACRAPGTSRSRTSRTIVPLTWRVHLTCVGK